MPYAGASLRGRVEYDGPGHLREKSDYAMRISAIDLAFPSRSAIDLGLRSLKQRAR